MSDWVVVGLVATLAGFWIACVTYGAIQNKKRRLW